MESHKAAPGDKRRRQSSDADDLTELFSFISLDKKTNHTFEGIEIVFPKVFKATLPKWQDKGRGLFMIQGDIESNKKGHVEKINMSFWPTTGTIRFQGSDVDRLRQRDRWNKEYSAYLETIKYNSGKLPTHPSLV